MIFTFNVAIMIVIPIILSSRYFSKKYTLRISIATVCLFFVTAVLGAMYGNYDVNSLEIPKHTIIDMGENIWIADVIEAGGLTFDPVLQIIYHMLLIILFTLVIFLLNIPV